MASKTYKVTNDADFGQGSLREAVSLANENPGRDTILLESDVKLKSAVEITDSLYVGTPYGATIEQTGEERIFTIDDHDDFKFIDVVLYRLEFLGGNASNGGAIYSVENLEITDSSFEGNSAEESGGGLYQKDGTLEISRTSFENNSAGLSTAEGNPTDTIFGGGAIYLDDVKTFTLSISTFEDNRAVKGSAIAAIDSRGDIFNTSFETTEGSVPDKDLFFDNSGVNINFDFP